MERDSTLWIFQATSKENLTREVLKLAKKKKGAQNNGIRTNYAKEKIDRNLHNIAQSAGAVEITDCRRIRLHQRVPWI